MGLGVGFSGPFLLRPRRGDSGPPLLIRAGSSGWPPKVTWWFARLPHGHCPVWSAGNRCGVRRGLGRGRRAWPAELSAGSRGAPEAACGLGEHRTAPHSLFSPLSVCSGLSLPSEAHRDSCGPASRLRAPPRPPPRTAPFSLPAPCPHLPGLPRPGGPHRGPREIGLAWPTWEGMKTWPGKGRP